MSSCSKSSRVAIVCMASLLITSASAFAVKKTGLDANQGRKSSPISASSASEKNSENMPRYIGNDVYSGVHRFLNTPFTMLDKGTLVLGTLSNEGIGDPIEAFLHLFIVYPNSALEITHLEQLKGKVKINSPRDALAFVRLKTSPVTWYFWEGKGAMEVVSRDQIDSSFFFGDNETYEWLKRLNDSGWYGIVNTKSMLSALKIEQAKVKLAKNGFEIHRTLLTQGKEWGDNYLQDVTEFVGRNGSYSVRKGKLRKAPESASIKWILPTYE